MSKRRKARELTLQALFQWDAMQGRSEATGDDLVSLPEDIKNNGFSLRLFKGVMEHRAEIDQVIMRHAEHWSLNRMGSVDRNILRFCIFEFLYLDDIPLKVSLNEAIEIAKRYGSEESGKFVNGILDQVLQKEDGLEEKMKSEKEDNEKVYPSQYPSR